MLNYMNPFFHRGLYGGDWSFWFTPGGIIMGITFIALLGLVIYFIVTRRRQNGGSYPYNNARYQNEKDFADPVMIAKTRFAKGEITKEELTEILKHLK